MLSNSKCQSWIGKKLYPTGNTEFAERSSVYIKGSVEVIDVYPFVERHTVDDQGDEVVYTDRMLVISNGTTIQQIPEDVIMDELSYDLWRLTKPVTDWSQFKPTEEEFEATDKQAEEYHQAEAVRWAEEGFTKAEEEYDEYCAAMAEDQEAERQLEEWRFSRS